MLAWLSRGGNNAGMKNLKHIEVFSVDVKNNKEVGRAVIIGAGTYEVMLTTPGSANARCIPAEDVDETIKQLEKAITRLIKAKHPIPAMGLDLTLAGGMKRHAVELRIPVEHGNTLTEETLMFITRHTGSGIIGNTISPVLFLTLKDALTHAGEFSDAIHGDDSAVNWINVEITAGSIMPCPS